MAYSGCIGPELEEHAAEDPAVEQGDDREIQGAQKDAVHQRKGDKEGPYAEDEPRLIRVPDRCDAAYQEITLVLIMREGEQESCSETEAVKDHIEDESHAKKGDPDMNNVHVMHPLLFRNLAPCSSCSLIPIVLERQHPCRTLNIGDRAGHSGPFPIIFMIYNE